MKTAFLSLAILPCAHAATLTGSGGLATNTTSGSAYVFPGGAGTDWGYFNPPAAATADLGSISATNTSNVGPRTFTVTAVTTATTGTTTQVRGSGMPANSYYSFSSSGTSPASGSGLQVGGVFNAAIGSAGVNNGVQMSLSNFTGPTTILLYVYNFRATGQLSAFVNGSASAFTPVSITDSSGGKITSLYSFTFTPDLVTDTVRFEYIMTNALESTSNVGFVAVAVIPEPASLALLGIAGSALAFRRRR